MDRSVNGALLPVADEIELVAVQVAPIPHVQMFTAGPWITLIARTQRQDLGMQRVHELRGFHIKGQHGSVTYARLSLIIGSGDDEHRSAHTPSPADILLGCVGSSRTHGTHQRIIERD